MLGIRLWEGEHEGWHAPWLRWCDDRGNLIPTGKERSEQEKTRAEQEKLRAEQEKVRADNAEAKAQLFAEKLRELGINPDTLKSTG